MHFIDDLVFGVGQILHVVVDVDPRPGAGPGVAFDEDVLAGRTCGADAVNGCLVEVQHEILVHVVIFVVCLVSMILDRIVGTY